MLNIYFGYVIGVLIGTLLLHGFTRKAGDQVFDALFFAGVFGVILTINGTYTTT
jgi:hypothetical protein